MFYQCRRRYISLLEIMLVLSLIALIGGAVAYNLRSALTDQRFRSEVDLVAEQLRLAQDIMLTLDQNVMVKFRPTSNPEGIEFWMEFETVLPQGWDKELVKRKKTLRTIRSVAFQGEIKSDQAEELRELRFMSRGAVMSKGIVRLSTGTPGASLDKQQVRYICLTGSPAPIHTFAHKPSEKECELEWNSASSSQLTSDTMTLFEKFKMEKKEQTEEPTSSAIERRAANAKSQP